MKKLVLALWVLAVFFGCGLQPAFALDYKTVDIRKTGQSPVRETFWAGDSIEFGYALEENGYSYDLSGWDDVSWEVCTYTNPAQCWMAVTGRVDDAESGELSVRTDLPLSVVPEGQYRGYIKGLKLTASNTVASQRVLVEQTVTVRYGQTEFPPDAEDNGDIIAGGAYVRQDALDAEAATRAQADNVLSNAIAVLSASAGGEPIWPAGFLPAKRDESTTNEAYAVEFPTAFVGPLRAPEYGFADDDDVELPTILNPTDTVTNNGLARFDTSSRSFGRGLVLNSSDGSFLRMSLGDLAWLIFSRESPRGETKAHLKGETVTITAESYDADEDATVPGRILLEGNIETTGDVLAGSFTLPNGTWTEWPDVSGIAANAQNISALQTATNALQGGVSSNANRIAAVDARIDTRIDSLYGECRGGYRWPDYFRVTETFTGVKNGGTTNEVVFATNTAYNIVETLATNSTMRGWQINTEVIRKANENDSIAWEPYQTNTAPKGARTRQLSISPEYLEVSGNMVYFKEGVTEEEIFENPFVMRRATVRGKLGNHVVHVRLPYDSALQATNNVVARFVAPAPGSLMAQCWSNIFLTASNAYAQGKGMGLRTWPQGYGNWTNHVEAGWNTNFWAYGLGDFSCISYHTDGNPRPGAWDGGVYQPVTMVTPRHGIVANHWKPIKGSNVYWVSRSGAILTNRVIAYKNIRSDLTVARLDHAFDTNDIMPAKLLANGYSSYTYGSTNTTHDCPGFPVLSFDCAERGWVSLWTPYSLGSGRNGTNPRDHEDGFHADGVFSFGNVKYEGPYKGNGGAVGGDSGSPTFLLVDGQTILLGCFYTAPGGGPMPQRDEVNEAILDTWGDEERCVVYDLGTGGWYNPDVPTPPH